MDYREEQKRADAAEYRTAMLLWLAFGMLGAHRFYMSDFFWGCLILLLTVLAVVLLFIWGFVLNAGTGGSIAVLVLALAFLMIAGMIWISDFIRLHARVQQWQEKKRDIEKGGRPLLQRSSMESAPSVSKKQHQQFLLEKKKKKSFPHPYGTNTGVPYITPTHSPLTSGTSSSNKKKGPSSKVVTTNLNYG